MGHRVAKPGEELAVVSEDVAVMEGNHAGFVTGQHVPEAKP